jgi:hypothetical protein
MSATHTAQAARQPLRAPAQLDAPGGLLQVAACDAAANHLRDNWSVSIKNIIKAGCPC